MTCLYLFLPSRSIQFPRLHLSAYFLRSFVINLMTLSIRRLGFSFGRMMREGPFRNLRIILNIFFPLQFNLGASFRYPIPGKVSHIFNI